MPYRARLRIALTDRPGALGRIGQVVGDLGGNVLTIDVQEVDGPTVVDELLVDLPDDVVPADVAGALEAAGAGSLLTAKPGSDAPDQVVRALRWACALASAGPYGADEEVERAVAEVCG
ncbi:MAG: ACT domain-containing protein, partial [Actinomycetota bacterium]|nr:ACT domain-containing protein [Actinomycetota bacterium]